MPHSAMYDGASGTDLRNASVWAGALFLRPRRLRKEKSARSLRREDARATAARVKGDSRGVIAGPDRRRLPLTNRGRDGNCLVPGAVRFSKSEVAAALFNKRRCNGRVTRAWLAGEAAADARKRGTAVGG